MRRKGTIIIRGIVQGVGFRPFVYAQAKKFGISGDVLNLGSEVKIRGWGERFEEFLGAITKGTPLSHIDSIEVVDCRGDAPHDFTIAESTSGALTGLIPPDVAICEACISDINQDGGRYEKYWATSCVNCGPRYSIIHELPYDRERTSMSEFTMCNDCLAEYSDPHFRRHHAQTIACDLCGPHLQLLTPKGESISTADPIKETASYLDRGKIVAIRGLGGFHIACIEDSAGELKRRLGRTEQPFAIMVKPDKIRSIALVSDDEWRVLTSPQRPIMVLKKKKPHDHSVISNLHTIGCMIPYTGLHHLLFSYLTHELLIMTSANMPGYPMITDVTEAMKKLGEDVDFFLIHDRRIVNRCDDSVIRNPFIIRLSRGIAPKRTHIDLGKKCILGVGPELNSNVTLYKGGACITSPHIGHVRNPPTLAYLKETVEKLTKLTGASYDCIAHDLHPAFLSTRYAKDLAVRDRTELTPVQHHEAHIAATTLDPCVGIAIDGVGYGRDGTVWGGEIFAGTAPHFQRVAHLQYLPMPGGDLATQYPERMLYGILRSDEILDLLSSRGWEEIPLNILKQQVEKKINVVQTSSTGRVLDSVSALLGICRERTYDGEPAMRLEAAAYSGQFESWPLVVRREGGVEILSTRSLVQEAFTKYLDLAAFREGKGNEAVSGIAASFQFNLARGIAQLAVNAAHRYAISTVALSGGVAYNEQIRETIRHEVEKENLTFVMNREYPLGDGCISYGQCVMAGLLVKEG